ncbi:sucrose phosphate synthase [Artemisia annua]|uniref:Sucrose phosphate synthase n=1 Tax=Artemisia annua TaxID=35608 RepID=A0A2U1LJH1_ARTAN|nr:sucrose phosphate synthase [Artemisia annua]
MMMQKRETDEEPVNQSFIDGVYPYTQILFLRVHGLYILILENWVSSGPNGLNDQVLDNGLLIDPQDQQLIAYALLKLFADKQLWAKSRANGLRDISILKYLQNKNLHFLVTYLFHVASSSMGATGLARASGPKNLF